MVEALTLGQWEGDGVLREAGWALALHPATPQDVASLSFPGPPAPKGLAGQQGPTRLQGFPSLPFRPWPGASPAVGRVQPEQTGPFPVGLFLSSGINPRTFTHSHLPALFIFHLVTGPCSATQGPCSASELPFHPPWGMFQSVLCFLVPTGDLSFVYWAHLALNFVLAPGTALRRCPGGRPSGKISPMALSTGFVFVHQCSLYIAELFEVFKMDCQGVFACSPIF